MNKIGDILQRQTLRESQKAFTVRKYCNRA